MMLVPEILRTERLLLRPWREEDALVLRPILTANRAHLEPWIPHRVSDPATLPELILRMAAFGEAFAEGREWRYGVFTLADGEVLGEVGLYPRSASGRVASAGSDRVEIGYWLREDRTGRGFATEAARAMLGVAGALPGMQQVEIRCDARNSPSAAIPRRLGFTLEETRPAEGPDGLPMELQLWTRRLGAARVE